MEIWRVIWGHVRPNKIPSSRSRLQQEACHVWSEVDNALNLPPHIVPPDYHYSLPMPALHRCCSEGVSRSLMHMYTVREICLLQDTHIYVTLIQIPQCILQILHSPQTYVYCRNPDTVRLTQTPHA